MVVLGSGALQGAVHLRLVGNEAGTGNVLGARSLPRSTDGKDESAENEKQDEEFMWRPS